MNHENINFKLVQYSLNSAQGESITLRDYTSKQGLKNNELLSKFKNILKE